MDTPQLLLSRCRDNGKSRQLPLHPSTTVNLAEGTATIVYAIGSLDKKTLDVAAQVLTGLHSAPGGVPTGTGGLADPQTPWWSYAAVAVAAAVLVAVVGGVRRVTAHR
jgi:hypothetical protein